MDGWSCDYICPRDGNVRSHGSSNCYDLHILTVCEDGNASNVLLRCSCPFDSYIAKLTTELSPL